MTDNDLRRYLKKLPVPEALKSARDRARHRAIISFQQGGSLQPEQSTWRGIIWNWRGAVALAFVVGLLPLLSIQHHDTSENLANDRQILGQMQKLFPDQVNAVVEENGKVDLSVAQSPVIGSDQPVLVVFKHGSDMIRVLSYSGHRVCLMLGKEQKCFEILATTTGSVVLEGEDNVWLASEHPEVAGYSMQAQALKASL